MIDFLLFVSVAFLSFANGANDNFKGVATLYGSGILGYRKALSLGTLATFAGSMTSLFLAEGLVRNFSGKGLVPDYLVAMPEFGLAVALGAGATVLTAAWRGLPISTTHALVGALVGAGLAGAGSEVNFGKLGKAFFMPLAVSPFMALAFTSVSSGALRRIGKMSSQKENDVADTGFAEKKSNRSGGLLDFGHMASAALVSFARGINDTPKLFALIAAASFLGVKQDLGLLGVAMAIGGILGARKVAATMSRKITTMEPTPAFTANLVTACLVIGASRLGMPVSTTHVSVGAISGIGLISGKADFQVIDGIFTSWVLTLPVAGLAAYLALVLINY